MRKRGVNRLTRVIRVRYVHMVYMYASGSVLSNMSNDE